MEVFTNLNRLSIRFAKNDRVVWRPWLKAMKNSLNNLIYSISKYFHVISVYIFDKGISVIFIFV